MFKKILLDKIGAKKIIFNLLLTNPYASVIPIRFKVNELGILGAPQNSSPSISHINDNLNV
jgi:hypothetical protein